MSDTIDDAPAEPKKRGQQKTAYLDAWRKDASTITTGQQAMTSDLLTRVINRTIEFVVDDEVPEQDRDLTMRHMAALLAREQTTRIMDRVEKTANSSMSQRDLFLLNEMYAVGEERLRLGWLTPKQAKSVVKAELKSQIKAIQEKWKQIEKLIAQCDNPNMRIIDQL